MITTQSSGKSPERNAAQAVARADSSKPLILVVEDHEDTRDLLRYMLTELGFGVAEAENGEDAIDMAERLRPGLILMDGSMPRLDGLSATRRMRERETLRTVPIVFLSGHAEPAWETEARVAGCDAYLVKPFHMAQLDRVLAVHLPLENPARP
jgi:two-component system phosphate regulon response regulator PhoB